ncbi:hypothetical protein REPUB_Repub15cG0043700 [Reevesia pubescens]
MAYSSNLFSLSLCFLVLFSCCCSAQLWQISSGSQPQQRQRRFQTECQIQNLTAVEPKHRVKSEAGVTELWDQNEEQFQCAGVAALRHKIQRRGLLLPNFKNAPQLIYVVQGRGIQGAVFAGCPETYQSGSQQSQSQGDRQQGSNDRHQKIRQIKEGDVIALPAGVAHWIYNNGETRLVLVSLIDVANVANQLDLNFRNFFLAGNPQEELVRGGQSQSQSQSRDRSQSRGRSHRGQRQEQEQEGNNGNNILNGFDTQLLEMVLSIDSRLVRKLQGQNDNRGAIVEARDFDVASPQEEEEGQRQQGSEEEEEEEQEQGQEQERGQRRERGRQGRKGGSEEEEEEEQEQGQEQERGQRREQGRQGRKGGSEEEEEEEQEQGQEQERGQRRERGRQGRKGGSEEEQEQGQGQEQERGQRRERGRQGRKGGSEEEEEEEEQEQGQGQEQERGQRRERGRQGRKGGRGRWNGLEETFCTMRLKQQINKPSLADIFNPRGGRITTVNSYNLPILQFLQLSAEKGVLYRNALYAPHWNVNAHSIVYITRGNGRIQIVRENGDTVFDDQVEEGRMIVVPQNFAVLKKAGNQGLEWIAFKTNANAKINPIAGRASALRAMPQDVLVNSYRISREDARRLKENRQEMSVFSPASSSRHQRG